MTDNSTGRRRKKSCVPRLANPGTCEECFARGVQCRTQEVSLGTKRRPQDGKHDLQQRVVELETALLSISQKLESTPKTVESNGNAKMLLQLRSEVMPSTPVASPVSNPEALLEHAPVLSLFDNAILSRRPDNGTMKDLHGSTLVRLEAHDGLNSKFENIRQTLLSFFPSQQRQEAILNGSYTWWAGWQNVFPRIYGLDSFSNIVQFVRDLIESCNAQKIAKALLCLLIILQEGPVSLNTSYDTLNAADQTRQALSIIDDMVLADDEVAATIDGVECMLLRCKFETNSGRIRRAWLTIRRGISLAQLLGLHKRLVSSESDTSQSLRRESLWEALYTTDRLLSLHLGLPYGPSETHSDIGRDCELSAKGIKQVQNTDKHYLFRLASIAGHIIDRNQQLPSNNMLPLTFKIEAEIMELAASMPSSWWDSWLEHGALTDHMYGQLLPQFWHHQARTLLHLPFMLKATTDRRFEYNKIATLESAREMIARYRVIRPLQGFGSLVCKLVDFQVFTAAMILVINLLDHYWKTEIVDHREAENDQDLVLVTTEILRRASVATGGSVATQAARALEIFSNIRDMSCHEKPIRECSTKLVIPYFGAVVIGPGTSFRDQKKAQKPDAVPQPQQLPTPSEPSLDGSTPESAPSDNPSMAPMVPFDDIHGGESHGMGMMSGDVFADVNFDLDQDWSWFWNNIDIPSVDLQGTAT